jgi:hypothetical protein
MKGLRRWEIGLILGVLLVLAGLAYAQFAYESVTVSSASKALTAGTYGAGVKKALITCETNSIRFTLDGVQVPTSAGVGHLLYPGQPLVLENRYQIVKFRAVRASATDATLKVTYF